MSQFSEYLDEYMEEHSISSADLARDIGSDRTTVHRYRKGKRIPADESVVSNMADVLRMRVNEKNTLLEKYDRLVLGEAVVDGYKYVRDMLNEFAELEKEEKNRANNGSRGSIVSVIGSDIDKSTDPVIKHISASEVLRDISGVLYEARLYDDCVHIVMQPSYSSVMNIISNVVATSKIRIDHIICIEKEYSKSYKNLELFRQVLPMCFKSSNYNVLYYYDRIDSHINEMSPMPNMIITNKRVILFDYDMKNGMLINDKVFVECMQEEFNSLKSNTRQFLFTEANQIDIGNCYNMIDMEAKTRALLSQPCLGACMSDDIYEKFLYPFPEKEEFISIMCNRMGNWKNDKYYKSENYSNIQMTAYTLAGGMKRFMDTGRANEFPDGYYAPLDMEARKIVMDRMICACKERYIDNCFLPDDVELPESMFFYFSSNMDSLIIHKVDNEKICRVDVREPGILGSFRGFFEYIEKKNMITEGEEIVRILEEMCKMYQNEK